MAYIKVDHSKLEAAASSVDTYVSNHRKKMQSIGIEINGLSVSWSGKDYAQVKREWEEMNESGSTSAKMIEAMENYAKFLRYASGKYKEVQSRAVNRANSLPKW